MANVSPLKITDLSHPNSTNILNKWADTQGQQIKDLTTQIKTLQDQVTTLQSNTTSTNSSTSSSSSSSTSSSGSTQNVLSSRALGTVYHNTSGKAMYVSGWCLTHGSSTGEIDAAVGTTSTPSITVFKNENTASVEGAPVVFAFVVASGNYYTVTATGDVYSLGGWTETTIG